MLPEGADGLPDVEAKLSAEALDRWVAASNPQRVDVKIPRFDVEPQAPMRLGATLRQLGMTAAFDPGRADFSGMAPGNDLDVDEVFHQAVVKMNEAGTEAAAATGVTMTLKGMPPPPTASFHADRPFLFLLRDVKTGLVLFAGRVVAPSA